MNTPCLLPDGFWQAESLETSFFRGNQRSSASAQIATPTPSPIHPRPCTYIPFPNDCCIWQVVTGELVFEANEKHSYFITMTLRLEGTEISSKQRINLQDQMYHYLTNPSSAGQA